MKKSILSLLLLVNLVWADFTRDDVKKVVTDNVTKLMWQDDNRTIGDANKKTWENAITFCENLDFAGYTNWHLPNFNELYSIADRSKYNPAMSSVFINVVSSFIGRLLLMLVTLLMLGLSTSTTAMTTTTIRRVLIMFVVFAQQIDYFDDFDIVNN
jgi:hypothetical protein